MQIANYMLPAMQIVCHLVASGTDPANTDDTTLVSGIDQTTPQPQPTPEPLPDGYVAHPDVGFAYKVYNESVTAIDAKRRCIEQGAKLALIDSTKKLEYVQKQKQTNASAYVGIIRMYDDKMWVAVSTGLPVSSASIPWASGNPSGSADCVRIPPGSGGLNNFDCSDIRNYVCEIPILKNIAIPAN